jgi:hypothetical protein
MIIKFAHHATANAIRGGIAPRKLDKGKANEQPRRHADAHSQITQAQMVKKGTHGHVDPARRGIKARGNTINAAVDEGGLYGTRRVGCCG